MNHVVGLSSWALRNFAFMNTVSNLQHQRVEDEGKQMHLLITDTSTVNPRIVPICLSFLLFIERDCTSFPSWKHSSSMVSWLRGTAMCMSSLVQICRIMKRAGGWVQWESWFWQRHQGWTDTRNCTPSIRAWNLTVFWRWSWLPSSGRRPLLRLYNLERGWENVAARVLNIWGGLWDPEIMPARRYGVDICIGVELWLGAGYPKPKATPQSCYVMSGSERWVPNCLLKISRAIL